MTPARLRRLQADFSRVQAVFSGHARIRLVAAEGSPPEKYTFEFHLASLVPGESESFELGSNHRAEVFLPVDYPRRPPFCRMITPVIHPNIDPQKICIGDHWSAGQSLADLVVRIGELLCYQSYNVKSPLNAEAAAWVERHQERLPLERIDLTAGL
jgi:ubiquitin-protein ligase